MEKIILLLNWKLSKNSFWLQQKLIDKGINVKVIGIPKFDRRNRYIKWRKVRLIIQYSILSIKGIKLARKQNSVIISWSFFCGIITALLSSRQCNKVVALNMVVFEKSLLPKVLKNLFLEKIFSTKKIITTVNSNYLLNKYQFNYKIPPNHIHVLKDPWSPDYEKSIPNIYSGNYIFSGGEAARDWDMVLRIAEKLPQISFRIIARKNLWYTELPIPQNVQVRFDAPKKEFYSEIKNSRFVILPIKGKVTAGLTVLIRSVLLGKLVIATNTPSTQNYYPETCQELLVNQNSIKKFIELITLYWNSDHHLLNKSRELQRFILDKYSPDKYTKKLIEIIKFAQKN